MNGRLARVTAAELVKLRGLPAVVAVVVGTPLAAVALALTFAAVAPARADAVEVVLATVTYLQVGPILLGVLTAATEHTGRQIGTTLTVTPDRRLHLAAQSLAYAATAAVTVAAGLAAGLATVVVVRAVRGTHAAPGATAAPLLGALAALVLLGLLAHALTVVTRSLVGPLVTVLVLVLVLSPVLPGFTEHARWLPDRAGALLYLPDVDPVLGPVTGGLVLVAWVAAGVLTAGVVQGRRDA